MALLPRASPPPPSRPRPFQFCSAMRLSVLVRFVFAHCILASTTVALASATSGPVASAPASARPALVANPYPAPPVVPPAEHPRVYFRAQDLPRLRADVLKPQNARAWAVHLENLRTGTDGKLPPPAAGATGDAAHNVSSRVLATIESLAFDYALRGDATHGRAAITALRNYVDTVVYPPKDYNNTGQTVFTIGAVYDWCYPLLTSADREFFIAAGLATAAKMEIGWPPLKQGNVTGHGPEAQLQRDLLAFAIATYDERPDLYAVIAGRFFDRFLAAKRFMYPARMHTQGNHYTSYRFQWEILATLLFDRMGHPEIYGPDQRHALDWLLYARRPDGQVLRDGDTHINNKPLGPYFTGPSRPMFLAANYFRNPYLKTEALRQRPDLAPSPPAGNQSLNSTELLIFNDPDLAGRPLDELPLSQYFPSPKGAMIARTGWAEGLASPSVVAEFKINEWYFANHQHLDAGAFQLYYRGALALDAGYYQAAINTTNSPRNDGSTGYGSLYDLNFYKRSIAHNVITVYDPAERFESKRWAGFPMANDGGQRFPNRWEEPAEHEVMMNPANGYRIATVLGHGFGPDTQRPAYTYLKGDLARAYSEKVSAYERSFVFLNLNSPAHPAALVVFDRVVAANPAFRKAWLLHGLEEPTLSSGRIVTRDTRAGYTGKLTTDTLLPTVENTVVEKIGSPDGGATVNGTHYLALLRPEGMNEGGRWRVEVSPRTPATTDYFLHVLQVGDHTPDTAPLPVRKLETATHVGALIADRVVVLAKARDRTSKPVSFSFAAAPAPAKFQILIADLTAGKWRVECDDRVIGTFTAGADAGTIYFTGPAGAYRVTLASSPR